jgi:hypothetical protein
MCHYQILKKQIPTNTILRYDFQYIWEIDNHSNWIKKIKTKHIMFNNTYIIIQKTSNNIFHFFKFLGFNFILLQKVSSHLDEHCRANFSFLVRRKNMCYNPEWITLQKKLNLHSRWMQGFQVQENNFEQIIIVCFGRIKCLKGNGTKRRVKHVLVRCVMYKKCISIICT